MIIDNNKDFGSFRNREVQVFRRNESPVHPPLSSTSRLSWQSNPKGLVVALYNSTLLPVRDGDPCLISLINPWDSLTKILSQVCGFTIRIRMRPTIAVPYAKMAIRVSPWRKCPKHIQHDPRNSPDNLVKLGGLQSGGEYPRRMVVGDRKISRSLMTRLKMSTQRVILRMLRWRMILETWRE